MLAQLCLLLFSATSLLQNVYAETDSSSVAEEEASMRSRHRLFPSMIISAPMSTDEKCARDSRHLEAAIANFTLWAMTMSESSARESVAVLSGSTRQLGDYDQCLVAEAPFGSQFCMAAVKYEMPLTGKFRAKADHHQHYPPDIKVWDKLYFTGLEHHYPLDEVFWGLCVPSSCNAVEMEKALKRHFMGPGSRESPVRVISVRVTHCSADEKIQRAYEFDVLDLVFVAIVFALFSLVTAATVLDLLGYIEKDEGNRGIQVLQCFSSKRTLDALGKDDRPFSGIRVQYLSGMRFLTVTFLVGVHRVLHTYRGPVHNYLYVYDATEKLRLTGVIHGQTFVDTCFFLAGFFVAFIELSRPKQTPLGRALLLRYIRLTPPYAVMILFYVSIYYKLGSGPLWDEYMAVERDSCRNYWWTNLLYINNYVPTDTLCMFHSWSLAADMHYFIAGTLILALLRRNVRLGYAVLGLWLFLSVIVPFTLTAYNHWPPMLMFYPSFMKDIHHSTVFRLMYSASHNRAAPYVIGLIGGVVVHRFKNVAFRFGTTATWSTEIVAWIIGLPCLLTSVIFYNPLHEYDSLEAAFYASLVPVGWALALVTCTLGAIFGVPTASSVFLTFKPFVVLSRLTYCLYLVHWSLPTIYTASLRSPYHTTDAKTTVDALGDMMNAYLLAFLLYLLVEAPTRQLARVFIGSESDSGKLEKKASLTGYVLSPVTDADVNSNHKPNDMIDDNCGMRRDL